VVIVDGCASCHVVHGSPNRHLLRHQTQVNLCYECHSGSVTPGWHSAPRFLNEKCTACHTAIHGSNTNPLFLEEEAMTTRKGCIALIMLLLVSIPVVAEEDEKGLTGSVEVLYRNVNQNGSTAKFNEDFDGLSTGGRLGSLSLNWVDEDSELVDYARLDAYGLGGDPFERIYGRIGSKDRYELRIDYTKQDYIYNLFELMPDEDGSSWDSTRRKTDIGLTLHVTKKLDVFFKYRDGDRSGNSSFMKDINRNLFRLETPLDYELNRYSAGVNFEVGPVNIVVSQMHRSYDNNFNNTTEGDLGLEAGGGVLFSYDWMQRDRGNSDWTNIKVSSPLGRRANLTVSLLGTLLGEDELKSTVDVEQLGLDANGNEYGGSCAISGITCGTDTTCDAVTPGDVCVADQGVSDADLEGDVLVIDADLSVTLVRPLALHLRYRSLERDFEGIALRDLDGDGIPEDINGDGMAVTSTRFDYEIETTAAVLEYRPNSKVGVRGGYKVLERELVRDGFGPPPPPGEPDDFRDTDFKSDDDKTVLLGLVLRPVDWFRFNADYEDGDVEQPFTAPLPERAHPRPGHLPAAAGHADRPLLAGFR
jgi:predicted CXXCH cytochrome family protein